MRMSIGVARTGIRAILLPVILLCAVLLAPGVRAAEKLPAGFFAPRDEILARVRRVAYLPTNFEAVWPRNAAAAAELEALTTEMLAKGGITAIPLSVFREFEQRISKEQGGWYDPQTGRTIEAKRTAIFEQTLAELTAAHQLDGFAKIGVNVVQADLSRTDAQWHGIREPATYPVTTNAVLKFLDTSVGTLPALSVSVMLFDTRSKQLYGRYGGLQLLTMTRETKGVTDFPDVAADFILSDPVRNRRAVRLALQNLVLPPEQIKAQDADFRKRRAEAVKASTTKGELRDEEGNVLAAPVIEETPTAAVDAAPALRVPLADLRQRAGTLALAPALISTGRRLPERGAAVEQSLTQVLQAAGFKVVPSSVYTEVYLRHDAAMGPYFDAVSGEVLKDRVDALNAAVFEELRAQHGAGGIARPSVIRATALHDGRRATWDGVTQSLAQGGSMLSRLNAGTATGYAGTAPALSLSLRVVDAKHEELFVGRSGLQLLRRMSGGLIARLVDVKDEELLTDAQLGSATGLLLESLATPVQAATP